jgi:monoterpene epsilon-lactone hydrolase
VSGPEHVVGVVFCFHGLQHLVSVCVIRPASGRHGDGGGYVVGNPSAYIGLVSQIAARAQVATFALDYPLAPEAQLPDALDLAVATLARRSRDHSAVALAGDSAGGGLALATAGRAHREGLKVAALAAFSPWTDLSLGGASVRENAIGDPLLDPGNLRASAAAYLGSAAPDDPSASPLFGDMDDLPPLLMQVGTDEILLDDSRRFAAAVEKAGGTVQLEVWQVMHHVFQLNIAQLVSARRALDTAGEFLSRHLAFMIEQTSATSCGQPMASKSQ